MPWHYMSCNHMSWYHISWHQISWLISSYLMMSYMSWRHKSWCQMPSCHRSWSHILWHHMSKSHVSWQHHMSWHHILWHHINPPCGSESSNYKLGHLDNKFCTFTQRVYSVSSSASHFWKNNHVVIFCLMVTARQVKRWPINRKFNSDLSSVL